MYMRKIFQWAMAAALICGISFAAASCSSDDDEKKMENLTMEVLKGLWVADYAESGTQGDKTWTRTVEAFQFNEDKTTYHESFQLNGEKLVKVTAIRDDATFSFSISGNTITIKGTGDKTVAFTYADGKLTTPEGKVLQKATAEQKTLVEQLYAEWQSANSSSREIGYIECSLNGNQVVKTPKALWMYSLNEINSEEGYSSNLNTAYDYWYVTGSHTIQGGLKINKGETCHIVLCDGCDLKVKYIIVDGGTLNIYGQEKGTGKLTILDPGIKYAAIGAHSESNGVVNIHGGVITVKGGDDAAGIGGGYHNTGHFLHEITIYDGIINATGGSGSAGIGCGLYARGEHIYIYGGDVTAQGGNYSVSGRCYGGAGIGGSNRRAAISVFIAGGNVKAYGGTDAAGIGAGENAPNGDGVITISGGTVLAQGASYAAGIGGGDGVQPGPITIYRGEVYAYAGKNGAGIGGGEGGESGNITIKGGTVRAYGDRTYTGSSNSGYGSGIGSGQAASVNKIIIKGGDIAAYGGEDGAGIGTGEEYGSDIISGTIEIHGGKVWAEGKGYGAGIGAGEDATFGVLGIFGGRVDAHAGSDCGPWSGGIGAYHSEHEDGCHIGWAGWERIYIGACMRLWTYSPNVGHIENVHYTENWWDFVHQRPQVAFGECNHVDGAYDITNCPYCHSYTLQLK